MCVYVYVSVCVWKIMVAWLFWYSYLAASALIEIAPAIAPAIDWIPCSVFAAEVVVDSFHAASAKPFLTSLSRRSSTFWTWFSDIVGILRSGQKEERVCLKTCLSQGVHEGAVFTVKSYSRKKNRMMNSQFFEKKSYFQYKSFIY